MPKLTKAHASKATQEAETWDDSGFEPLDPGYYLCRLLGVEQKEGKTSGQPYWSWKYESLQGERWLWDNTSLSEKAIGRLGKVFEAFGVPADTDTDEMTGMLVNIQVGVEAQATGKRAGQMQNVVLAVLPGDTHPEYHSQPKQSHYGDDEPF